MPPRSMNAPYSVRFLTIPSTIWPSFRRSSVDSFSAARSFSRSTRRDSTMLPRFLLNLMTLNLKFWPRNASRLRTGRRSTCEPGRNAFTPPRIVTERPPFTRAVMTPSISSSRSHAALISSHTLNRSAFSLERTHMPDVVLAGLEEDVDDVARLHADRAVRRCGTPRGAPGPRSCSRHRRSRSPCRLRSRCRGGFRPPSRCLGRSSRRAVAAKSSSPLAVLGNHIQADLLQMPRLGFDRRSGPRAGRELVPFAP